MSNSPISIASTSQIWDSKAVHDYKEDKEEAQHTSVYVDVFQSIHSIVMEREKFLFSEEELACFQKINTMSYAARYLLIRICLRKRDKWHSVADLEKRYKIEIGGKERITEIIDELCGITRKEAVKVKYEERDIIDLTQDENEDSGQLQASLSDQSDHNEHESAVMSTPQKDREREAYVIAEDDAHATLSELLGCLTLEELKNIGKQLKITRPGQNRSSLSDAIASNASNQTTLSFPVLTPRKKDANANAKVRSMRQPALTFSKDIRIKNGVSVVRQLVLKSIGRCIRICQNIFSLFDRLNIVFFRSTNHSSPLLLPALLTAFRKRRHAETPYVRTTGVFPCRQALLDYEEYLALEARIEEALSGQIETVASPTSKNAQGTGKVKAKEPSIIGRRVEGAQVVRDIWKSVYDRWKLLIACKDEERSPGLQRFDCGHVLTRIVHKGAEALGILKEHDLEIEVLEALLAQIKWGRGKRGAWYDRLALVLMTHREKTQENLEIAMNVVIDGLRDNLTHLIYRPRLERRLTRLEKRLNVPMSDRHNCDGQLQKAREVYVEGVRVKNRASSVILDKSGRIKGTISFFTARAKSTTSSNIFNPLTQSTDPEGNENTNQSSQPWKGKTLWVTKQGEEVSVEQFALDYYHGLGFKGFHSEGRIVSTVFGLLFWDVIFAPVPGAFETPFQTAPLDIFEDSFYLARRELIDQRLAALESGEARHLLEQVLERERPHRTSCIGIDWDFKPDDLLDIVDCLGGHALAIICRVLCERYGQWQGGVPDLFIWNIETLECRFVEVKSPNDRLQENQKVWIDVLIGSETPVDLCHVLEKGEKGKKGMMRPRSRSRMKDLGTPSDVDSVESEFEGDVEQAQNLVKIQDHDSDEFVSSLTKKRKTEVAGQTPRKTQRSSCV